MGRSRCQCFLCQICLVFKQDRFFWDQVDETKKRRPPRTFKDIQSWRSGDKIYYNRTGSIGLNISTGHTPVYTGVGYSIKGGQAFYLEKVSEDTYFISISPIKTTDISVNGGAYIAYIGFDAIKQTVISAVI